MALVPKKNCKKMMKFRRFGVITPSLLATHKKKRVASSEGVTTQSTSSQHREGFWGSKGVIRCTVIQKRK